MRLQCDQGGRDRDHHKDEQPGYKVAREAPPAALPHALSPAISLIGAFVLPHVHHSVVVQLTHYCLDRDKQALM